MLFSRALLAAALGYLGANAAPTVATTTAGLISTTSAPRAGPLIEMPYNVNKTLETTRAEKPRGLVARGSDFYKGKIYNIAGWSVIVGRYIIDSVGGTSWAFPEDNLSIDWLVQAVSESITSTYGNGKVNVDIAGGWHWYGEVYQGNYNFQEIPYQLISTMLHQAFLDIHSWQLYNVYDNVLAFDILDSAGHAIYNFQIYPTINNGVVSIVHNEL